MYMYMAVTSHSTNRAGRSLTLLKWSMTLPLCKAQNLIQHYRPTRAQSLEKVRMTSGTHPFQVYSRRLFRQSFRCYIALASLTCYTLLSPSITFSLFHSELKTNLFRKPYPPPNSVSVCRTDLMALDRLLDLYAHQFLCFSSISFCFSCSYVLQTKMTSSLVNFWAHDKL